MVVVGGAKCHIYLSHQTEGGVLSCSGALLRMHRSWNILFTVLDDMTCLVAGSGDGKRVDEGQGGEEVGERKLIRFPRVSVTQYFCSVIRSHCVHAEVNIWLFGIVL